MAEAPGLSPTQYEFESHQVYFGLLMKLVDISDLESDALSMRVRISHRPLIDKINLWKENDNYENNISINNYSKFTDYLFDQQSKTLVYL